MPPNGAPSESLSWSLVSTEFTELIAIWDLASPKCAFACDAETGAPANKIIATRRAFRYRLARDITFQRGSIRPTLPERR